MNAGIYLLNKKIITNIKKEYKSLESDIIAKEIDKKKVVGRFFNGFFLDIGTPKNLIKAKKIIPKYFKRPAVFLDRDGTINHDRGGYTHSVKNFKFIKGTIKILKKITNMNYYIFIITNQAGIAKKKFTLEQFYKLHDYIKDKFLKNKIYIHDVKFCPYHPEATVIKYKKKTAYRKPGNLMLEDLKTRWDINLKKSLMVGDKKTDLLAAKKSNIKFMYLNKNLENTLIKTFK
jgi:D-glycero-D-manno-heptose 1,7-bisphosphate phosphatase